MRLDLAVGFCKNKIHSNLWREGKRFFPLRVLPNLARAGQPIASVMC